MKDGHVTGRRGLAPAICSAIMAVIGAGLLSGLAACGGNQADDVSAKAISALQQRVQRLEDVNAIEKLTRAYGYFVDKNLWDQIVPLFADDGTVELDQRGAYAGKAGVERMFVKEFGGGKSGLKYGTLFNHIQAEGIVDVDPDGQHAQGRWHAIIQVAGFHGNDGFWSDGVYENEYVKDGGVWKFRRMRFWPTYYIAFPKDWDPRRFACINGDGSGKSPGADRPSTDRAGVYPDVFTPPFHYANPVTGQPIDVSALNAEATAHTAFPRCGDSGGQAPQARKK